MLFYLATAAKLIRIERRVSVASVAQRACVERTAVYRFEASESWPRNLDVLIGAYAAECQVRATDIWCRAIVMRLGEEGLAPLDNAGNRL